MPKQNTVPLTYPPLNLPSASGWHQQLQAQHKQADAPPAEPQAPPEPPAYTAPATQADLDRIISDRLARERSRFADYNDLKAKAARVDELENANRTDAEKAINAARDEGRAEVQAQFTAFQVRTALAGALAGRNADPAALLDLDRTQFVKNGAADTDAITAWVEAHSTAATPVAPPPNPATVTPDPGQGVGGTGGTTDAGRAAYERRHPRPATT